ncbi:histidine kinase [Agromyces endophyticus]|uniref:sensor histidine kinase n=1 Tax=Agromyces sp. H17E-10 TaxID=2932244 RepID=UPI001FD4E236|nr:histidine kinase [Agromyces sp. H17E-10]UOQ88386.1 histidine kinase [Agromyces sp. H17E-10]
MLDASTTRRTPGLADWAWAAAAAAALLPFTVAEVLHEAGPDGTAWAVVVLALFGLLHLGVAGRRLWPRTAIVAASAVMLLLAVASLPGMPGLAVLQASSLAYLAFVYGAAASDDRVAGVVSLVCGLVGAGIITGVVLASGRTSDASMVTTPGGVLALFGSLAGGIGAAWALGRYRRETLRKRAAQALAVAQAAELRLEGELRAVADERRRIARELHDVIAHSLAVMVAQAEASRLLVGRDDDRARGAIEHVVATGRAAMGDMRGLLGALAAGPSGTAAAAAAGASVDAAGAAPREPSPGLDGVPLLVERSQSPGRDASLVVTGRPVAVRPGVGLAAYRVVQESLTNTLRHTAAPTRTEVRMEWGDELVLTVEDDGLAVPVPAAPAQTSGRGLRGMRDRVEQAGGSFEAGHRDDRQGWRVVARLPLDADADAAGEDAR